MLTSKRSTLKPLLESKNGVHLTAYLVNRGDLIDLKTQLSSTINEAYEWLSSAMTVAERKQFLEPLDALLMDARIFKQMKGNIGLFRNKDSFRVLNVPVEIEHICQVASSFHVKPLLRWLQTDQEFLLLGFQQDSAHLYLGSQDSFKLVDSILYPNILALEETPKQEETYTWLSDWITELTKKSKPRLFLAGENSQIENFNRKLKYSKVTKAPIADTFGDHNVHVLCSRIRTLLKEESKASIERALLEFRFAESGNRARKNIFQIAKAVVEGKVRKLIVTDELSIFGRIDPKCGTLSLHPYDLDHEDDDVLDDLAQMVLSQGGEVVIAKRDEIPKGRPILAILDEEAEDLEKTEDLQHIDLIQERFG